MRRDKEISLKQKNTGKFLKGGREMTKKKGGRFWGGEEEEGEGKKRVRRFPSCFGKKGEKSR